MKSIYRIYILLLLAITVSQISAQETQTASNKFEIKRLWQNGEWLVDPNREYTIDTIQNATFNKDAKFDHGITPDRIWERYRIVSNDGGNWVIFSRWYKADRLTFYAIYPNGEIVEGLSGSSVKYSQRSFKYRRPTFELHLEPNQPVDLYVYVDSRAKIHTDLKITGALNYFQHNLRDERILFWVFGAILAVALYNLIVFISTRDKNYLYYFLYIFFMLMYDLTVEGFGRFYFWPNWGWLFPRGFNIFMSLSFVFGALFARSFLNLKELSPKLNRLLTIIAGIFSINTILFFLPVSNIIINWSTLCFFFGIILLFFSGIYAVTRGYKPARFYLIAWIFLIVGSTVTTFRRIGVLPANIYTEYAIYIGTVFESILLAFALGDRVLTIQNKKLEAEEALIDANNRILQNRMKPHFLFNSMNIIFNQIRETPEGAMKSLGLLSDNYHYITEFNDRPLVSLEEEISFLKNYIKLMKLRWPEKLEVKYSIDSKLTRIPVPPFILQPLAENAFKYGLKEVDLKFLEVQIYQQEKQVVMEIINSTKKKPGKIDYSRSLGNIINRLQRYYKDVKLMVYGRGDKVISKILFKSPIS